MKQIIATMLLSVVAYKQSLITCNTGILPSNIFKVTLDTSTKFMTYEQINTGLSSSGTAVFTEDDGRQYYHLQQSFSDAVQMFYDGGTDWWLCRDQSDCLRCGQILDIKD